jgi:hypothetical protein
VSIVVRNLPRHQSFHHVQDASDASGVVLLVTALHSAVAPAGGACANVARHSMHALHGTCMMLADKCMQLDLAWPHEYVNDGQLSWPNAKRKRSAKIMIEHTQNYDRSALSNSLIRH